MPTSLVRRSTAVALGLVVVAIATALLYGRPDPSTAVHQSGRRASAMTVARRDFVRAIRLSGTVEAVQATTIAAPRLAGQNMSSLVITRLVRPGSHVQAGDLVVEFDRQDQLTNALNRRAELNDLEHQIRKRQAQEAAAAAKDDSDIVLAESAVGRAQLEMTKNELLPKINAEKNKNALEQAQATLKQLKATYDLKRRAAQADLQILQIRHDRAENAMRQAEGNAERMAIRAPIGGMAVLKTVWKTSNMAEVQEGEEIRPGVPVVDIVDPKAMRVRARVNQADVNELKVGQPVKVGLDAYPDLSFDGRVAQISPLGVTSTLNPKVRNFIVLIDVHGSHPNLMPDLTASLDVELDRVPGALVVPRDALGYEGDKPFVRVQRGSSVENRFVTLGKFNTHEVVVASGLEEGASVVRRGSLEGAR
jgi:multidrug efflux pump subunit AcrA (membrane-fusion protein)